MYQSWIEVVDCSRPRARNLAMPLFTTDRTIAQFKEKSRTTTESQPGGYERHPC